MIKPDFSKLENYLNTWLKENDFECEAKLGTDFSFHSPTNTIYFSLTMPDRATWAFTQYTLDLGLKSIYEAFALCFFHELGHYETENEITDEMVAEKEKLLNSIKKKPTLKEKDYMKYYKLPMERMATEWAVDYINNHESDVHSFQWKCLEYIVEEYERIGLMPNEEED